MGEWYTSLVLDSGIDTSFQLDSATAAEAAAGWGGDTYAYYANEASQGYVFVWMSAWDTNGDADEFFTSSQDYGTKRWGTSSVDDSGMVSWIANGTDSVSMTKTGDQVLWIISNDSAAYEMTLAAFAEFK
jgi:hypothetical protein